MADPLDAAQLRERVYKALSGFLAEQRPVLDAISDDFGPVAESLSEFVLDGGKRLRPAFCYWGWRGAGGPDVDEIVAAASCLELLHACALIHDDVMDESDTRRGRPSVHRSFAGLHRGETWLGDPESFGRSAAILLGDVCLVWADQLLHSSGIPADALTRAVPVYNEMRIELMAGQYLDVLEQQLGGGVVDRAMRICRFKSGKYTVEGPLRLGGVLAGASPALLAAYSAYGTPLGTAFQLRDDVLGVFGDPAQTGKPAGDDLREGKRTVLVAKTLERSTPDQAAVLRRLGDPHLDAGGVDELRTVIRDTGALADVEALIAALTTEALDALDSAPVDADARSVLRALASAATDRSG